MTTNKHMKKCGRVYFLCWCILMVSCFNTFGQTDNNRFIPGKIPGGFVYAQTPEYYGTYEHPQKNGTIYDYIDGGGEVYIKHGFHNVAHFVLKITNTKDTITLDIYNLGTPENAKAAYADEAICPKGFNEKSIGFTCKTYNYEPDYLIYFIKGKYLVYLGLSNDTLIETLNQFAGEIYNAL